MLPSAAVPTLFAVMLSLLLWLSPERHAMWLWGWAAILALPQRRLPLLLHTMLAALCWWQVQRFIVLAPALSLPSHLAAMARQEQAVIALEECS